jgi:hypothetical protein
MSVSVERRSTRSEPAWEGPDDRSAVEHCPVCDALALVGPDLDPVIAEIGVGLLFRVRLPANRRRRCTVAGPAHPQSRRGDTKAVPARPSRDQHPANRPRTDPRGPRAASSQAVCRAGDIAVLDTNVLLRYLPPVQIPSPRWRPRGRSCARSAEHRRSARVAQLTACQSDGWL